MFIGEYHHSLDAKSRVAIPAKFRDAFAKTAYLTKGLDGCLMVYAEADWRAIEEKMRALPLGKSRNLQRMLFANAELCVPDSQWRIVVPQELRDYAHLEKEVTIIGVGSRAEFWNSEAWDQVDGSMTSDDYAEAMDELGF